MVFQLAHIEAAPCIGCTKCLLVCPTGAIVGATRQQHAVQAALCTGCGSCVPVCPVACIALTETPTPLPLQTNTEAETAARTAHEARKKAALAPRPTATARAKAAEAMVQALSTELLAEVQAARAKSAQKYASKGPLRTPKALETRKDSSRVTQRREK